MSQFLRHGRPAAVLAAALLVTVTIVRVASLNATSVGVTSISVASAQAQPAPPSQAAPPSQPAPLRMSLDWRLEGPLAMFLVAQDRGYFREEGLDVTIDEGSTLSAASTIALMDGPPSPARLPTP